MLKLGTPVIAAGYKATFVAHRPDLGGTVVAMTGEDGTTPGEQFVIDDDQIEISDDQVDQIEVGELKRG